MSKFERLFRVGVRILTVSTLLHVKKSGQKCILYLYDFSLSTKRQKELKADSLQLEWSQADTVLKVQIIVMFVCIFTN